MIYVKAQIYFILVKCVGCREVNEVLIIEFLPFLQLIHIVGGACASLYTKG